MKFLKKFKKKIENYKIKKRRKEIREIFEINNPRFSISYNDDGSIRASLSLRHSDYTAEYNCPWRNKTPNVIQRTCFYMMDPYDYENGDEICNIGEAIPYIIDFQNENWEEDLKYAMYKVARRGYIAD